ncbi:MAG TPA: glycosyltransferase family 4 protein [Flavobacteriales bacterium]|nr:glycosyltransferase family 4 protein [Flavobacteriales bacterium]
MKILFYYTSNQRSISMESVMIGFKKQGHDVLVLTQTPYGKLHEELEKNGIPTYTHVVKKSISLIYYWRHVRLLVGFLKKHQPQIVYSHLQQANIVAVFAQRHFKARFYICRHHTLSNAGNERRFDKIINKKAQTIIVPSQTVFDHLVNVEKVSPSRIKLIYYGYDFSKYNTPSHQEVEHIRKTFSCKLLMVKIARLVEGKRYIILFDAIKRLVFENGLDIKLIVISDGPLFDVFTQYITENKLEKHIFLLGQRQNIIDYLSACDIVPLLSESEASNNVIKEAGLAKKAVIVCKGVGDFSDYISNEVNGFLVDKENPYPELVNYIMLIYKNQFPVEEIGKRLQKTVIDTFSIDKVLDHYTPLNQ